MDVFFHNKDNLKKDIIKNIICLVPLYLYAIYKNGIILYNKNLINFFLIFKIVYFLILTLLAYILTNKILKKKITFDLTLLSLFVIPLFLPFNTNPLVYFLIMFLFLLFRKYYNIAVVILIFSLLKNFSNPAEISNIYSFTIMDLLWGRNIGGIGSTSIIIGILIAIILTFTNNYKYLISASGISIFVILSLIFKEYSFLTSGNAILSLLLISNWSNKSPMLKKSMLIYGLAIGILGFIFMRFINVYYGMILSIAIASIIYNQFLSKKFNI